MTFYVLLCFGGVAIGYANHCMAMSDSAILDPAEKALTLSRGTK